MDFSSSTLYFFVLLTTLFFLPKLIYKYNKIPFPLTEIALGLLLGMFLPDFFRLNEMVEILATLGIITLFVYAGMEVNTDFIVKNRTFFFENAIRHLLVVSTVAYALVTFTQTPWVIASIISVALTTPSASYILSSFYKENKTERNWIASKSIIGEVVGLILLIVLLKINSLPNLLLIILVLGVLIFSLPPLLEWLFQRFFSGIKGTEFSLIFVVAMISAFITEYLGIHYLIGAFIAGIVSRNFVTRIVKDNNYKHVTINKGHSIIESFNFFASTFIPFYFFSIGLQIDRELISSINIELLAILAVAVPFIVIGSFALHRKWRIKENFAEATATSAKILPTLVFTFVIANILKREFEISDIWFSTLIFYGIITSILGILVPKIAMLFKAKNGKKGSKAL